MIVRIIRYMRTFFLFLAVALLNAHMIIPHDHHLTDSDFCQGKKYPVSKDRTTHHPSFPAHCHAFNDLASEKAIVYNSIRCVKYPDIIPGSVVVPAVSNLKIAWGMIFDFYVLPVNSVILELSSLRAPPFLT
ncbi:MAG TPA: hypothetical protein VF346_11410 [Bacteroidales bacterium]